MSAPGNITSRRHNLPLPLTSFLGRDFEIKELNDLLHNARLVTVTGAGGCGKTRMALRVAEEVASSYPDGVWWVDLSAVSASDQVARTVARTFGLREEPGRALTATLADKLAGLSALLLIDNCEQVLDECGELVDTLLQEGSALQAMATSREPLGIQGEQVWRVPSLDDDTAYRLFVERAGQIRPGFSPKGDEDEAVRQICSRLDGIPLAIELAAARVRMMHPARIAAALDNRFRLLTGGGRTAVPRQQTLETSVAWSYELLEHKERALLKRLSVFAGGFTLEAAESVCSGEDIDVYGVLDLLSRLVDKSVVQVDHQRAESRFRLLESIRIFARDRLIESGESAAVRDRHRDFFLELAERAEPELASSDGPVWLSRLEVEHDNLRSALGWSESTGAHQALLRLVSALTLFWELRGHLAEGSGWFVRALRDDGEPSVARARALWGAAHAAVYSDDYQIAAERAPQALEMGRALGDAWSTARALNTLGWLQLWFDPAGARAALEQSIQLGAGIGDNWVVADGWKMITVAWLVQEDHHGLREALKQLNRVSTALGNKFFIAWYHCCVGWGAVRRGEFKAARDALATSLSLCDEVGEPATGGVAIAVLADVESLTGEYDAAEARLKSFLDHASATGGAAGVPVAVPVLAAIALGRGNAGQAREILGPFVEELRPLGIPLFLSWALSLLGAVLTELGEFDGARTALAEARDLGATISNPWLTSMADSNRARLARRQADTSLAERLHHEALALRVDRGLRVGVVESLEGLAFVAADLESYAEAARLLGAASELRRSIGFARWPAEQDEYDRELNRYRDALGEAMFDDVLSQGKLLSLEEAVAYASRARGERKRPSVGWASLTPTELEVAALVGKGLTNPQIGEQLFISRSTVKTHLTHIFSKLGVKSRAALASENTRRDEKIPRGA